VGFKYSFPKLGDMSKELSAFFKMGKAEAPVTPNGESQPSEAATPLESLELPDIPPEEETAFVLNTRWPNSVFKFFEVCDYIPRFDSVMQLRFGPEGIDIEGMDTCHVAKIHIHLDKTDFYKYKFTQPERIFCINFQQLAKKVKRFQDKDDEITITLDLTDSISFQCRGIHFCQKSVKTELEEPVEPAIEFKIACTTSLPDLVEVLKFASDHTDFIYFNTKKGLRVGGSCADDNDDTPFHKDLKIKTLRNGPPAETLYHVGYLLEILNITVTKFLNQQGVLLELSDQMPLRITLPLSTSSFFQAYLANRAETEEEPKEEPKREQKPEEKPLEADLAKGAGAKKESGGSSEGMEEDTADKEDYF